jgi:hypothetical protein
MSLPCKLIYSRQLLELCFWNVHNLESWFGQVLEKKKAQAKDVFGTE